MHSIRTTRTLLLCALFAGATVAWAEDTDLFLNNPSDEANEPNVVIILDNTANWNTAFTAEKDALAAVVSSAWLDDRFNLGLMMFTETGGGNSGQDGSYVRYAVRKMTSGNKTALTSLINGLGKIPDRSNSGKAGLAMYEAYQYFHGGDAYAGSGKAKADPAAFISGTTYNSPITNGCAKNYIIYLSNGPAQDSNSDTTTATNFLKNAPVNGNATTLPINPIYPNNSQSNIADEWANHVAHNDINIIKSDTQNIFVYTIDVRLDPSPPPSIMGWSGLLENMALYGKGSYSLMKDTATLQKDLEDALKDTFKKIQDVNSVFASSTLPVSVNVRGSFLNQVYMGVFRPDADALPRWVGNLKQYKINVDGSGNAFLADSTGTAALNTSTGVIDPNRISFWTSSSTFWTYLNPTATSADEKAVWSDSPDGSIVEKGGAAQRLRTTTSSGETSYTFDSTKRKLYTCTSGCTSGSFLSATPFSSAKVSTSDLGAADATERDQIINWVLGLDNTGEDTSKVDAVRPSIHADVVHSRPAAINYGGSKGVVLYYGSNDGVFHAVKGGQAASDGIEYWGFVAPEFFKQLKRQRNNSPALDLYPTAEPRTNGKPYFMDGPIGVYRTDANNDGEVNGTDVVYIYPTMRRGGRTVYALDVTNPEAPKFLWKKSSVDYPELGQTWSLPTVTKVNVSGHTDVLIFGAGYDATANASITRPTAASTTMGRGVFVLDALTGEKVWMAGHGVDANVSPAGMDYSIAADLTVLDRDGNGKADRVYATDVGGNIWRIDINDASVSNWAVSKLATVGGDRRFLFPPDVVYADVTRNYDAVLIGSGDREHPLDNTIVNRFYMFKDKGTGLTASATTITEDQRGVDTATGMYDATADLVQVGTAAEKEAAQDSLDTKEGWYITLSTGEKVVGSALTLNGTTYFGTNLPVEPTEGVCEKTLGEARSYALSFTNASATIDQYQKDGIYEELDRYQKLEGGGLPPSPVYFSVDIDGKQVSGQCQGMFCSPSPGPALGNRYRTYWYQEVD